MPSNAHRRISGSQLQLASCFYGSIADAMVQEVSDCYAGQHDSLHGVPSFISPQSSCIKDATMKTIDSTIVSKSKFVTVVVVRYEDRKGNFKEWHMVTRSAQPKCITGAIHRPDAAIIVPYHREKDKLVVIREYRVTVGGYMYGFPAGLLDPGEDLAAAAGRELHEETGLELVRVCRYSPAVFSSAGITDETIAMVFAEVEGTPNTHRNEDSEEIEVFLMDRDGVRELLNRRDIAFGARAWLVMEAFVRMGKAYLMQS
jgi:ADP-ribose pyrophosphatase